MIYIIESKDAPLAIEFTSTWPSISDGKDTGKTIYFADIGLCDDDSHVDIFRMPWRHALPVILGLSVSLWVALVLAVRLLVHICYDI